MKTAIFLGYTGLSGQVQRIVEGWIENGNAIFDLNKSALEYPDIIYANDSGFFDQAISLKEKYKKSILILNVLDLPKKYYPNLNLEEIKNKLNSADIITTISEFSKKQIKDYLNLDAKVIYNPIKNINKYKIDRDIDFLYIGRLYEQNKRFGLGVNALSILNVTKNQFFIAGPDDPGQGLNYLGEIDDHTLNMLYNRCKFLICPTEYGVLGLPPIEAAICGCVPILCNDNEAAKEFQLVDFSFNPNPKDLADGIASINNNHLEKLKSIGERLFNTLNKNKIAKNIEDLIC